MNHVHGGVKFYSASPTAAGAYIEADRSRVDDYYLHEGTGPPDRFIVTPAEVRAAGPMDGATYERWWWLA